MAAVQVPTTVLMGPIMDAGEGGQPSQVRLEWSGPSLAGEVSATVAREMQAVEGARRAYLAGDDWKAVEALRAELAQLRAKANTARKDAAAAEQRAKSLTDEADAVAAWQERRDATDRAAFYDQRAAGVAPKVAAAEKEAAGRLRRAASDAVKAVAAAWRDRADVAVRGLAEAIRQRLPEIAASEALGQLGEGAVDRYAVLPG